MVPQFSLDYQVMYYDTDTGGVVHNLAYLRWVEECRTKMARSLGIDFITMAKEENKHIVLISHDVHYLSPAFPFDNVRIDGRLEKAERATVTFFFEIHRAEDNKLCVTVRQQLALVQMPQGRPCRIPLAWRDKTAPMTTDAPGLG